MGGFFVYDNRELQEEMDYHYQVVVARLEDGLFNTVIKQYERVVIFGVEFKPVVVSH
jgi:hypothetical protein